MRSATTAADLASHLSAEGAGFEPDPAAQFAEKAARIAESLKLALFYRPGAAAGARLSR